MLPPGRTHFDYTIINYHLQAGMTALHSASVVGSVPAVRLLLRNVATVNAHDLAGDTALHYACHCGHTAVVIELLKGGADPAQPALVR